MTKHVKQGQEVTHKENAFPCPQCGRRMYTFSVQLSEKSGEHVRKCRGCGLQLKGGALNKLKKKIGKKVEQIEKV